MCWRNMLARAAGLVGILTGVSILSLCVIAIFTERAAPIFLWLGRFVFFTITLLLVTTVGIAMRRMITTPLSWPREPRPTAGGVDQGYCGHCEEVTDQFMQVDWHERDSSRNYQECLKCGYRRFSNKWLPPDEEME